MNNLTVYWYVSLPGLLCLALPMLKMEESPHTMICNDTLNSFVLLVCGEH